MIAVAARLRERERKPAPGCSTGELNAPASLVTVCASESLFVQWTVVPCLTVTIRGPKAKLRIVTASAATGLAAPVPDGAAEAIPAIPEGTAVGTAVGNADGDPDVPGKPASACGLAGEMRASAEPPPLAPLAPHAATARAPATATAVVAARQRNFLLRG